MEKRFTGKILKLALPITVQQFMLALVSACDAFMLGGLNQSSLSAVSLASQIAYGIKYLKLIGLSYLFFGVM